MITPDLQLADCLVPDIPEAQVSIVGNKATYLAQCIVETERGSFSSGQVDETPPQQGKMNA